ncbi:MAG TPA: polyprenyl synthetase family protein [Candidatus Bilamarchaeum sp.]|nr:polyprenyl synthetase family protein [Candidatus Bilamarchaeum sp.]
MDIYPQILPYLAELETSMKAELEREDPRIYGMLSPFIARGGKRIRPALAILSCCACGGKPSDVMDAATVIELFHNFTLIHDDIEDDSQFRRGEPTLHISHGIPMALNSGDALYTLLWRKLVNLDMRPARLMKLERLCAGAFKDVVDGQGVELSWIRSGRFDITEDEYRKMIDGKTSALMGLSCEAGALSAGAKAGYRSALRSYGELIGAAFQIQDDVLNLAGDFGKYKKEIGGDISEGKRTLIVVHSLANSGAAERSRLISILTARSKAKEDIDEAIGILRKSGSLDYAQAKAAGLVAKAKKKIGGLPGSDHRESLMRLADYVVARDR